MNDKIQNDLLKHKAVGAILGAAYGDALGWPNEFINKNLSQNKEAGITLNLISWTRRSGERYYPFEERINKGDYSDDTQLILAVARSLLSGINWFDQWSEVELPLWTLYARGGGGATKRAADACLDGYLPWIKSSFDELQRYFNAGGNGVAMRVLPHVIFHKDSLSFEEVAESIFLDGIVTHGHPRALLGALAYGYALWRALHAPIDLGYGQIIQEMLDGRDIWLKLPTLNEKYAQWIEIANKLNGNDYLRLWRDVGNESISLIERCKTEIDKSALAVDDKLLSDVGAVKSKFTGAGTVSMAVAIYFASRYAIDPLHGIVKPAFVGGADTDTIASMTGGLLGLIAGDSWLSNIRKEIQDADYLESVAEALLLKNERKEQNISHIPVRRRTIMELRGHIFKETGGSKITMPDKRVGTVEVLPGQNSKSDRYQIQLRKISFEDGQSIFLHKITKEKYSTFKVQEKDTIIVKSINTNVFLGIKSGIKIPVKSLSGSKAFYRDLIGLHVIQSSQDIVVFEEKVVLVQAKYLSNLMPNMSTCSILYFEVNDLEKYFTKLKTASKKIITMITKDEGTGHLFFRVIDPDGNIIEISK